MKKQVFLFLVSTLVLTCFLSFVSAEIRINEVMPHSNNSYGDEWVELYNNGDENLTLMLWKISDGIGNNKKNFSLNISARGFALILDISESNCSFFNIAPDSCFELAMPSLNDGGDNLSLYNSSSNLIDNFTWNIDIKSSGKSWGYNGTSWTNCTPTPGLANNCTQTTITTTNTTTQNSTTTTSTSPNITLSLDWDETEIINGENFSITLKAYNLKDEYYDIMIWIENDDEKVISDRYGNYSNKEIKWASGGYWIYKFIKGPGNKSDEIIIKIQNSWDDFSGEAKIKAKIRDSETETLKDDFEEDIEVLENDDSEPASPVIVIQTTPNPVVEYKEEVIYLGSPQTNIKQTDSIIYKSKSEYIKEYTPYGLGIVCIIIIILLLLDKKSPFFLERRKSLGKE